MFRNFFRSSDHQLVRRGTVIALMALMFVMLLTWAFARIAVPASPLPARPEASVRGKILSADGKILATGSLKKRRYPHGTLAGQVVGFVGASEGLEGAERIYNDELQRGGNITLTLDTSIQAAVEAALFRAIQRTDAEYGSVIVMETRTGNLKAVASVPSLDLGGWKREPTEHRRNRAFLDEYEPGSVMKALTVAALLNEGRTSPDTKYETPMWRRYAGTTINDIVSHPAWLDTRHILRYSSNVGMTRLVENVPAELLRRYFAAYGFGQSVDLKFPAADGLLGDAKDWNTLSQATMSFGQGMTVTTLQLVAGFNVIANGGLYVTPRLTAGTRSAARPVLSAATATSMREMLHDVIAEGIKTKAELPGYHVGGKTGTAQVVVGGRYSSEVFSSTFGGFIPADQPRFTVAVMVRGAKRDFQGSQLAAPIFKAISSSLMSLQAVLPEVQTKGKTPVQSTHDSSDGH